MDPRHKILLVDDEPDLLEIYSEVLGRLPSNPEIHTASNGARAMAMLEAHQFRLVITDLKMPKMDGLQMLSIVRRKYPALRTVVLTHVSDEQFRSRVYALGVDLYWQKPGTEHEIKMFCECIESLLDRNAEAGFRGVQSKSLVDIVQLECIAQSSSVLRITNGPLIGHIWINGGELVDAETEGARGEEAFQKILAWKTGSFETLPAEPSRAQTIFKSYNALLLETAQVYDETHDEQVPGKIGRPRVKGNRLAALSQLEGVEFVLAVQLAEPGRFETLGLENPEHFDAWTRQTLERFRSLGERMQAGPLEQIEALGPQRHVGLVQPKDYGLCIGWRAVLSAEEVHERMKKAGALWAS
jgi:CheY-like chemotaxis protein